MRWKENFKEKFSGIVAKYISASPEEKQVILNKIYTEMYDSMFVPDIASRDG